MRERLSHLTGSLAGRFVFAAVTVNLLLVSLFYIVIVNVMVANIQDDFISTARVKSDLIARLLPSQASKESARAALRDIMLAGEVVYADYGLTGPLLAPGLSDRDVPVFREDYRFGQHDDAIYFISVPLGDPAVADRLRLGFSEQGIRQYIDQIHRNGLYLSGLYLLMLVPLSILAARSLSRPIQLLRQSAHAIAGGEVSTRIRQDTGILELQRLGTDLETMRSTLVAREARYAAVLSNAAEGILTLDQDGHIETINLSAQQVLELSADQSPGMPLAAALRLNPGRFTGPDGKFRLDGRQLLTIPAGNSGRPTELSIAASSFRQDDRQVYVLLIQDITRHKELQDRLQFMAYHDLLTELPNRQQFVERLHNAIAGAARKQSRLAVLFLDLDHFKVINDSLGHQYGDLLLQEAGQRLCESVRETDVVARMGGDEFTILLSSIEQRRDAARVADKIIAAFAKPFDLKHYEHYVGASIGIAIYPEDSEGAEELVKQADTAMYQAKSGGRNRYHYYSEDLQRSAIRRLSLANNLRQALRKGELSLHYQPIVAVRDHRLVGAEALARWQHSRHGWISPGEFIPVAEETGIITDLGIWALKQVVTDAAALLVESPLLRLSVNISVHQLYHRDFFHLLDTITADHPTVAEHLVLEITETAAMVDIEGASRRLARIRDMGFHIALDDFGTGHSSLSYLRRLPVDILKIDRSFVSEMTGSFQGAGIVNNILALASNLQLKTVAEGVERPEQLDMLRDNGCYAVQGFLFSPAIPFTDFQTLAGQAVHGIHPAQVRQGQVEK